MSDRPTPALPRPGPGSRVLDGVEYTVDELQPKSLEQIAAANDVLPRELVRYNMANGQEPLRPSHILYYLETWWGLEAPHYRFRGGEVVYIPPTRKPVPDAATEPDVVDPPDASAPICAVDTSVARTSAKAAARTEEQAWDTTLSEVFLMKVALYDARVVGGSARVRMIDWAPRNGDHGPLHAFPVTDWIRSDDVIEAVAGQNGVYCVEIEVPLWGRYELEVFSKKGKRLYHRRVEGGNSLTAWDDTSPTSFYNMIIVHVVPQSLEDAYAQQINPWLFNGKGVGRHPWNQIDTVSQAGAVKTGVDAGVELAAKLSGNFGVEAAEEVDKIAREIADAVNERARRAAAKAARDQVRIGERAGQLGGVANRKAARSKQLGELASQADAKAKSAREILEHHRKTKLELDEIEKRLTKALEAFETAKSELKAAKAAHAHVQRSTAFAKHGSKSAKAFGGTQAAGRRLSLASRSYQNSQYALQGLLTKHGTLKSVRAASEEATAQVAKAALRFSNAEAAALKSAARASKAEAGAARAAGDVLRGVGEAQERAAKSASRSANAAIEAIGPADEAARTGGKLASLAKLARGVEIVGSLVGLGVAYYDTKAGMGDFYSARRAFRRAIRATGDSVATPEQMGIIESHRITADHFKSNYELDSGMALFDIAGLIPNPVCQTLGKVGFLLSMVQLGSDWAKGMGVAEKNFGDWLYGVDAWDINWEALVLAFNAYRDFLDDRRKFLREATSDSYWEFDLYKSHVVHDYRCDRLEDLDELEMCLRKEYQFRLRAHLLFAIDGLNAFGIGKRHLGDLRGFIEGTIFGEAATFDAETNVNVSIVSLVNNPLWKLWETEHDLWYTPATSEYVVDFQRYFPIDSWCGDADRFKEYAVYVETGLTKFQREQKEKRELERRMDKAMNPFAYGPGKL